MNDTTIISLGGSLIVPEEVDVNFLKDFKSLILSQAKNGKKFVIIVGGGKVCRKYQEAAKQITHASIEDLDWIGIGSIHLNAELLRVIFGDQAHSKVVFDLSKMPESSSPVIIGAAYQPGRSSDWDAVLAAKSFNAKKVINLSNTDYVYDSDPKKNPAAKRIEKISWADFRKIIPAEWTHSGMNVPFDPVASKMAEESGLEVIIMNGKPIDNLAKCLADEKFAGTVIS
jgi:uridylate kinase